METIRILFPGGRCTFSAAYIRSIGDREALEASMVLRGIKARTAVLDELYRAAWAAVEPERKKEETEKKKAGGWAR